MALPSGIRTMHVTDAELDALLTSPRAGDLRPPTLIVSRADGAAVSAAAIQELHMLPCVVVGDGHDTSHPPEHVDLVAGPDTIDAVARSVAEHPIAATTVALLLRGADRRSLPDGLVTESAAYSVLQAGPEFASWRAEHPPRRRPDEPGPAVDLGREDGALVVVLNRPHVRNALNRQMRDELLDAFALARHDPTIAEVTVRGEGPAFCSGGDLDEFGSFDDPASAHLVRLATSIGRAVDAIADRVTFRVHGPCAGSGIELPAFAGRVVASPDATFSLPEVSLGLMPGAGGTVSLTRRIGRHRVALLALLGRSIDAATAESWGLVDEIET